jgi:hypothetical protein
MESSESLKNKINLEEENEEEEESDIEEYKENPDESILFCHNKFCTSIPEIYFDEYSSLVYLYCNKKENKEKHKYCIKIKDYLKNNNSLLSQKLKKISKPKNFLSKKIIDQIEEMRTKIEYQKTNLEKITNDFNKLIQKIVDDYTFLLQNKLSSLIFQNKIINTYINCPDDANAIKNFKNLCNYMNTNISLTSLLILNKCSSKEIVDDNKNNGEGNETNRSMNLMINRISSLTEIFNYFSKTTHQLMSLNNNTINNEMIKINNMITLKNGNLCFSSESCQFGIYKLNQENERYEMISRITPIKNSPINYITQLSNGLLVCCTKKILIGELTDGDTNYNILQQIDEFDNYGVVKVIELSNNYLAAYDRGFQISIFMPNYNKNKIEYQLIFNRINKGEHLCSLYALPSNDMNDVQFISTSNNHYSTGKDCLKFYSSLKNYQILDTIYDINCSDFVDSLLMINKQILAVGIRNSYDLNYTNGNGIVLIDIIYRQIVTIIECEFPTAMYKLKNDLFVISCNKSFDDDDNPVPQKKINFFYIDEEFGSKNSLVYISFINSGTKDFINSITESQNSCKLIITGNINTRVFQ